MKNKLLKNQDKILKYLSESKETKIRTSFRKNNTFEQNHIEISNNILISD